MVCKRRFLSRNNISLFVIFQNLKVHTHKKQASTIFFYISFCVKKKFLYFKTKKKRFKIFAPDLLLYSQARAKHTSQ